MVDAQIAVMTENALARDRPLGTQYGCLNVPVYRVRTTQRCFDLALGPRRRGMTSASKCRKTARTKTIPMAPMLPWNQGARIAVVSVSASDHHSVGSARRPEPAASMDVDAPI